VKAGLKFKGLHRKFLVALGISLFSILGIFYFTHGWAGIELIKNLDLLYFFPALFLMFIVWGLDASVFWFLFQGIKNPVKFKDLFLFNLVGTLISNITPFYSGGPPAFIYLLSRKGVDAGKSALVLTARMGITAVLSLLVLPFLFLLHGPKIWANSASPLTFALPFSLILSLIGLLYLYTKPSRKPNAYMRKIRSWPLRHLLKNEKFRRAWRWSLVQGKKLRVSSQVLFSLGWRNLLLAALCALFYWVALLAVAPLVLYSLRVTDLYLFQAFTGQLALNILLAFSPTPGGSGAAELGLATLFLNMVPQTLLALFTLLWRLLTYHFSIIVGLGALFLIWKSNVPRTSERNEGT